jgi:2-keto-4-pentenoate hydratase/2-oxohepta-3-ene-1,7-dioic acid hydratase in catechol pathway
MTLLPGDIILTGTPAGVGFTRNPPEFLKVCGIKINVFIKIITTIHIYLCYRS